MDEPRVVLWYNLFCYKLRRVHVELVLRIRDLVGKKYYFIALHVIKGTFGNISFNVLIHCKKTKNG